MSQISYKPQLEILLEACREAGKIAMKYQQQDLVVEHKDDSENSPVTLADKEIDAFLKAFLLEAHPEYGWLSEETEDDPMRLEKSHVWIVDPIDGTKSFIRKDGMFSISAALAVEGEPVAGVVYNPVKAHLVSGAKGEGVFLNGQQVLPAKMEKTLQQSLCYASRDEVERGLWVPFEGKMQLQPVSSVAYKLALVAAKIGDMTASLKPKNEWDIAAGHLLCEEAGLVVSDLAGKEILYNQPKTLVNGIIAMPEECYAQFRELAPEKASGLDI